MATKQSLTDNNIIEWNDIRPRYDHPALLLGNGFSMMLSPNFSYNSLFTIFLNQCDDQKRDLFSQFDTTNFELIQKYLLYARKVNQILNLSTQEIEEALTALKTGLIAAIEEVHPRIADIDMGRLSAIAGQLDYFGDIFTTNYDLYLYHLIMLSKDLSKVNKDYIAYQDWFWGNRAPVGFLQFMDSQELRYKNVFYLHGSLFIFNNGVMNIKLKRAAQGDELIELIANEIRHDRFPVFVTEGNSKQKLETINNSNYLLFCLDKLKNCRDAIVIFGNSLGEFDNHIIDAIRLNVRPIIYCIYNGNRSIDDIMVEKHTFLAKFNNYRADIDFIDSSTVFV